MATASSSPSHHDFALGPPGLGELKTGTSPGPPVSSEVIHRLWSSAVLWFQLCSALPVAPLPVAPRPGDETAGAKVLRSYRYTADQPSTGGVQPGLLHLSSN